MVILFYFNLYASLCFMSIDPVNRFGEARVADTRLVVGNNNWQCLSKILKHHQTSGYHINAYLMWKELATRLCLGKTIDSELQRAC